MVAELLGINPTIITHANKVCNKLLDKQSDLMVTKRSRYNYDVIMDECIKCGSTKNLETDHIRPQCNADERGYFSDGTYKNDKNNLQVLCNKCHKKKSKKDNKKLKK